MAGRERGRHSIAKPTKPFAEYAWHFASYEPTEGLLFPPVYFGVLRAIRECEGQRKNSAAVHDALLRVERDTARIRPPRLRLARDPRRNLFRNSGQYWQSLGLLASRTGELELTALGREIADGSIPVDDFIAATIRTLKLPNPSNQTAEDVRRWESNGLTLRPLRLLLEILLELPEDVGGATFITSAELWNIVIPLAGSDAAVADHVNAITAHRNGKLSVATWPNCTPKANDQRSALEYLLFLARNGIVRLDKPTAKKRDWRFVLEPAHAELARLILDQPAGDESIATAVDQAGAEQMSAQVARTRAFVEQTLRPGQAKFKRDLLKTYREGCAVTGEVTKAVLIGAHIIPVEYKGPDTVDNGLLLRADIHILFDAGLLKIHADGALELHASVGLSETYAKLPERISLPPTVNKENLRWRLRVLHPATAA